MANVIKFEALEVEVLTGIANESAELVEASARKAVEHAERSGRALIAIKEKLPHGEWSAWLGKNFDYSQEHARRYMTIASNSTRVLNLKDATSIREALRMIADDPDTPKRDRKSAVEVIEVAADEIRDIAAEVAAECGVSRDQIIHDGEFAEAIDEMRVLVPDVMDRVRSGDVTQDDVVEAAKVARSSPQKATEIVSGGKPAVKSARPPQHAGENDKTEVFALGKADVAIAQLKGIPAKNKFREAALDRVQAWIDSSKPEVSPPPPKLATAKVARLLESIAPSRRARMEVILREEMKLWPPPAFEALSLILKEVVEQQLLLHGK